MPQQNNQQKKVNPEALLDMITSQAHNKAYEQAVMLSGQFVNGLLYSGSLKTMDAAFQAFEHGITLVQPRIEKDIISMSLAEIQATLPKPENSSSNPIPGAAPGVPAKA